MSVIGLSPNDLADWIRLLVRVAAALKEEGGSKSRYQQASQTVDATIAAVDDLEDFAVSANNILSSDSDGLQRLAQDLRKPFEEAKGKLTKYQPSLGVQARPGKRRGIFQKINWTFSGEPEVKDHYEQATVGMEAAIIEAVILAAKLEKERSVALGSALASATKETRSHMSADTNAVLTEITAAEDRMITTSNANTITLSTQLSLMDHNLRTKQTKGIEILAQRLDDLALSSRIGGRESDISVYVVRGMLLLVSCTIYRHPSARRVFEQLTAEVSGDLVSMTILLLAALSIQQCMIRLPQCLSLLGNDSIYFEDALGSARRVSFDTCQHFDIFQAFIRCHFQGKPGLRHVLHDQYHLLAGTSRGLVIDLEKWRQIVRPRSSVTMAIMMDSEDHECEKCKRRFGPSSRTKCGLEHVHCAACDQWFTVNAIPSPRRSQGSTERNRSKEVAFKTKQVIQNGPAPPLSRSLSLLPRDTKWFKHKYISIKGMDDATEVEVEALRQQPTKSSEEEKQPPTPTLDFQTKVSSSDSNHQQDHQSLDQPQGTPFLEEEGAPHHQPSVTTIHEQEEIELNGSRYLFSRSPFDPTKAP